MHLDGRAGGVTMIFMKYCEPSEADQTKSTIATPRTQLLGDYIAMFTCVTARNGCHRLFSAFS